VLKFPLRQRGENQKKGSVMQTLFRKHPERPPHFSRMAGRVWCGIRKKEFPDERDAVVIG